MCGRKGFFLSVVANGFFKSCELIVAMDVGVRGRIINDCIELVAKSKKMETRLHRCDLLLEHAEALLEYEQRGIPTTSPLTSQLLTECMPFHDQIVLEHKNTYADRQSFLIDER